MSVTLLGLCDDLLMNIFSYIPVCQLMNQIISQGMRDAMQKVVQTKIITFEDITNISQTVIRVKIPVDKIVQTSMCKNTVFSCYDTRYNRLKIGWYDKNGIGLHWHIVGNLDEFMYEITIHSNISTQIYLLRSLVPEIKVIMSTMIKGAKFNQMMDHIKTIDLACFSCCNAIIYQLTDVNNALSTNYELRTWFDTIIKQKNKIHNQFAIN